MLSAPAYERGRKKKKDEKQGHGQTKNASRNEYGSDNDYAWPLGGVGGLSRGLPSDPAVRVVELERRIRLRPALSQGWSAVVERGIRAGVGRRRRRS